MATRPADHEVLTFFNQMLKLFLAEKQPDEVIRARRLEYCHEEGKSSVHLQLCLSLFVTKGCVMCRPVRQIGLVYCAVTF